MTEAQEREMLLADIRRNIKRVNRAAKLAHEIIDEQQGHSAFVESVTGQRVPRESMSTN